ncbi:MAG: aminopeptidase P family protein [Bacteroidetes bacterium]|nr:MAG: aminopeptidase P family protein [Bacteroidota bacterium]
MQNVNDRIALLREKMRELNLDAYLVPSSDPHQSEYVAEHWESRTWLSGFTGSAGILVVTLDHAGLWTDSRYFLQAEEELSQNEVVLHKQQVPYAPEHIPWLIDQLPKGSTIGCDGYLFSYNELKGIEKIFAGKKINLNYTVDIVSQIWEDRPPIPQYEAMEHGTKFAGKSRGEKLSDIRKKLHEAGADMYVVSTLDDIAWTLNIRGSDVDYNPVCISYLIIAINSAAWFVDSSKVSTKLAAEMKKDGISLLAYDKVEGILKGTPSRAKLLVDPGTLNARLYEAIPDGLIVKGENIICNLKAIKNETEAGHIRKAMIKDGVALLRFYRWLEATLDAGETVGEAAAAEKLAGFRAQQEGYFGESFGAIVGYEANGAIVHYRAKEETCAQIEPKGILLLDSGGQYHDGTTDITRTTALSTPTEEQKTNYTLVLKGNIALDMAKFPMGTTGVQLDTLARMFLWQECLNYGHGTGHGVGFFLNVHEPPQGITPNPLTSRGQNPMLPGMFTSNEPGFYKTGEYGIRIENLVLCVEVEENEFGKFLGFETMTLFPIDTTLINEDLLNDQEKQWLNDYHQMVFDRISPELNEEEKQWLADKCKAI